MEKIVEEEDLYSDTSSEIEPFPGVEVIDYDDPITKTSSPEKSKHGMDELRKHSLKYVAEFVHYCYYAPETHPKSSQYNDPADMMQGEYADLIGFEMSDILDFIAEKLEENKNPKSILVKILFGLVRSGTVELSDKTEDWLKEMFYILSQNEYGKLPIFPVMELYDPHAVYLEPSPIVYHPPVYVDDNTHLDSITETSYV